MWSWGVGGASAVGANMGCMIDFVQGPVWDAVVGTSLPWVPPGADVSWVGSGWVLLAAIPGFC